jgi:hypothetical protein
MKSYLFVFTGAQTSEATPAPTGDSTQASTIAATEISPVPTAPESSSEPVENHTVETTEISITVDVHSDVVGAPTQASSHEPGSDSNDNAVEIEFAGAQVRGGP